MSLNSEQQHMGLDGAIPPAQHFPSEETILAAVLQRELELIAGSVPEPELRFSGETLTDELQVIARTMLAAYRSRLPLMGGLLAQAMTNPQVGATFYRTFILQGRRRFAEFLEARKQRGELREDVDVEAAAAFFLSGLTFSLLAVELFGGKQVEALDDERLVSSMSAIFVKGVQPSNPLAGEKPSNPLAGEKPSNPLAGEKPSNPLAGEKP